MKNNHKITQNPEFLQFIEEILPLNEIVNIDLQKTKLVNRRELLSKKMRDAREVAILKREHAAEELAAKARFTQRQSGALTGVISRLREEDENPYKANKLDSRPELDPEDRDRNRKREDRRQDKQANILSQVVIVKNNDNDKSMLILATDFDPKKHTLLAGEADGENKGPVSYDDIQNLVQDPSFMRTKTSNSLIGKIEKQQEENPEMDQEQPEQQPNGPQSMPQNYGAMIPKPQNGKEKIDPTSSYPDWDHTEEDFLAYLPDMFNMSLGKAAAPMMQLPQSQTLQKAAVRLISSVTKINPNLQNFIFTSGNQIPANTTNMWFNSGIPSDVSSGQLVGQSETGEIASIAVKIGPQTKLTNTPVDAKYSVVMALAALDPVYYAETLKQELRQIAEGYRQQKKSKDKQREKIIVNPQFANPAQITKQQEVITPDMELDEFETLKLNLRKQVQKAIVKLVNDATSVKTNIIYETLSGRSKFVDASGKATLLLSSSLDGTNGKLIPLTMSFCRRVAKGRDTGLNIIFGDLPSTDDSILDELVDSVTQKAGSPLTEQTNQSQIAEKLQKLFDDVQGDPMILLEVFESDIQNIVYIEPIYYSNYYTPVVNNYNDITFNPGFGDEKQVTIPVEDTENNKYNDAIENESQIMENYLLVNDVLADMIKTFKITTEEALNILNEEFNILCERQRDYKKEYREYHGKPEQIKRRAGRVKARRKAAKQGRVKKGDGKDVHHKNGNPRDNGNHNLQVMSKHKNRSIKEEHGAGEIGTDELRKHFIANTPYMVDPVKFVKRFKKK